MGRTASAPALAAEPDEQRQVELALVPAMMIEAQDEGEQVERERRHPDHRDRRDVGGEKAGIGDHQDGRAGGQCCPQQLVLPGRRRAVVVMLRGQRLAVAAAPGEQAAGDDEAGKEPGPQVRLPAGREKRLDSQRVGEQCEHRPEIGEREQPVGDEAGAFAREPGLEQRARRRQYEVGQADRNGEQAENAQRRVLGAGGFPVGTGADRQQHQAKQQQAAVEQALAVRREVADDPVRVEIAEQQGHLEEQHAGRPYRSRAAEPRQDHLADQRLDLEEQEGAEENRQPVMKGQAQVDLYRCCQVVLRSGLRGRICQFVRARLRLRVRRPPRPARRPSPSTHGDRRLDPCP